MLQLTEKNKQLLDDNYEILSQIEEWILTQPHIPNTIRKEFKKLYFDNQI